MNIKLTKLKELPYAVHPNNIEVGFEKTGKITSEPKVGDRFWIGQLWSTSTVVEIIDDHTFRTLNSIYHWDWDKS